MRAERLNLAAAVLAAAALFLSTGLSAQTPRDGAGDRLDVGGFALAVHAPYRPLLRVPGVAGPAHRFDGNSTWAQTEAPVALDLAGVSRSRPGSRLPPRRSKPPQSCIWMAPRAR